MKASRRPADGPGAVELVEEAVSLLRAAPVGAWVIYLAGAVPWVLGLGHYWAAASWFSPRSAELLWQAAGLAVLFLWLKTAQAEFCRRLRARLLGVEPPALAWRDVARSAARQARVQGWAAVALPVAVVLPFFLVFVVAFFESATALAATPDPRGDTLVRRAVRETFRRAWTTYRAALLFLGLALCVWVNVAGAFYLGPWLARTLLGVENLFGLSGWSPFNSTFLALVTLLAWLVVDPLAKTFHVLRTFYGEARLSGEDLRLALRRPARPGLRPATALALLLLGLDAGTGGGGPSALHAADNASTSVAAESPAGKDAAVAPAELDAALDEALSAREFRWRLQPAPGAEPPEDEDLIKSFVREAFKTLAQKLRELRELAERIDQWVKDLFSSESSKTKTPRAPLDDGGAAKVLVRVLLYGLLVLLVGALLWLLWVSWRRRAPAPVTTLTALAAAAPPPDLNDDKLEASRLPYAEWLELARAQMARGEWRLALRALYLGTLASLGAQGLVTLARAKTNLDYERELARRAAGREGLLARFRERRLDFERVWYGRASAEEARVRAWLAELEAGGEEAGA